MIAKNAIFASINLTAQGSAPHAIFAMNYAKITRNSPVTNSLSRYISGGLLKARNIDMLRVCRTKPRKSKPVEHKVDKSCRIGRTYAEFLAFVEQSGASVVEMDSVIGRIGGKVQNFQTRRRWNMTHKVIAEQGYITVTPVHHSKSLM